MGADVREMRLAHAGEVGIEQCTLPSSHRAAAWSMTARFVLAHKSVARERGRRTVTELSTLMLLLLKKV